MPTTASSEHQGETGKSEQGSDGADQRPAIGVDPPGRSPHLDGDERQHPEGRADRDRRDAVVVPAAQRRICLDLLEGEA